jgi:transposase
MRQETFHLSQKELQRVAVISSCVKGELTCARAAELLDLTPRQIKRLKTRYRQGSAAALAHVSRGRASPRRLPERTRARILELARTRYAGFNDHHFCEKLCEVESLSIGRETLRRLLRSAGIGSPRKRRAPTHRQRRLARAREGEMVLLDASVHHWLEDRGPQLTLLGFLDDATRKVPVAEFFLTEGAHGYFRLLRRLLRRYGVPLSFYGDRHGVFVRNDEHWSVEEQLAGKRHPTQFGRWRNSASPTSPPTLPRPRGASNAFGAHSRIVSRVNCAWPRPPISKPPTTSSAISCPTTTGASAAPLAKPKKPGVPLPETWIASAAFFTNARSATTTWCSGTAAASKSHPSQSATASPGLKCSFANHSKEKLQSITEKLNSTTPVVNFTGG